MLTSASLSVGTRSTVALFRVSGERMHLFRKTMPLMSNGEEKPTHDMIEIQQAVLKANLKRVEGPGWLQGGLSLGSQSLRKDEEVELRQQCVSVGVDL